MSIQAALRHVTRYRYERRIALGAPDDSLRPAPHTRAKVLAYSLKIEARRSLPNWQQDPAVQLLARAVFPEKIDHFTVSVDLTVEMAVINPSIFSWSRAPRNFPSPIPTE
jgi:hypothetical protein